MDASALQGRKVVVGVGGGIAAYKACELVRELGRAGAQVRVAMTEAARQFVTPLTFQALSGHPVLTDYFDPAQEGNFGHLDLARWAELYVVAPATADLLARMRAGMGGDAVTTSLLAFRGPVLLAPAMNVAMWENRRTQENVAELLKEARFRQVGPGAGELACGDVGSGRLAEVGEIVAAAARCFGEGPLAGRRVLITAGPTREYLDPVRFISNPSTGKMGLALAEEARRLGARVTVVLGPVGAVERGGYEV
ncbi:MAG TPA: bifunctional phosphopantothenoylcysteine decarboxylase/phosphopantothenate--cysteine ligase CoaBC, partial [Myxococcaceae bacterium]|nr:bifunctional phosphopantothenoylcysteine decarboxylase/phosphopantothenate--cysteine ligase CoaBC [Myxococcaceae bacterium]